MSIKVNKLTNLENLCKNFSILGGQYVLILKSGKITINPSTRIVIASGEDAQKIIWKWMAEGKVYPYDAYTNDYVIQFPTTINNTVFKDADELLEFVIKHEKDATK